MKLRHMIWVLMVALLIILLSIPSNAGMTQLNNRTMESSGGVIYHVEFSKKEMNVSVVGQNPTTREVFTGIAINVDGVALAKPDQELSPDQNWSIDQTLYPAIDASERTHSLTVSTFGDSVQFNFTREINTSNPGPVPTPQIRSVQITNGTIDGEPSTVAEVTVANPSKQTYPTKLMVHTTGTDGSFYGAPVPPGETRTITVELLEERGQKVAGEARLYTEGLNEREGAMDQVEFVGRAGADTRHWNTSYEPVRPPWVEDSYRYRNSSVTGNGGLVPGEAGSWWVYAAAGVVLLVWLARKVR